MLKNYLLTAFREIYKHKTFSFIHIFGLTVGITAFVLILQYALYELSFDNFYKNADQIYRIRQDRYDKGKLSTTWGAGCAAIGPALKTQFPEVIDFGRLTNMGGIINIEEIKFREDKMFAANTSFLTMFPVEMIAGDNTNALDDPFTAVISESIAKKYFGGDNAMGQSFKLNNGAAFKVTGVFSDNPSNTHLKFNILLSWPTYVQWRGKEIETAWFWDGYFTYIRLKEGTDTKAFEKKMNIFTNEQISGLSRQQHDARYYLQPLKSIHLHSDLMWEAEPNGDAKSVYFLMVIAFIIIIIAWVNYINLSTVKAIFRSKEVAMRKITGAKRIHLITQFLTESFIINLIALLLSVILVFVSMPYFQNLTGREMSINPEIWFVLIAMALVGPLVSGLYPAVVISAFQPLTIFRGKLNGRFSSTLLRKILVVIQFAASITLIAGTFTVYNQLMFMRNQDLGVNIDHTLIIKGPGVADSTYNEKLSAFKDELLKYPTIKTITASTSIPGNKVFWNAGGIRLVSDDDSKANQYRIIGVDCDFVKAYDLSLISGRSFSNDYGSEEGSVMFNEEAIKLMNFKSPESAIGQEIFFWGSNYKIIGVLKNFHQESLKENYDALIFRYIPGTRDFFSVKLNPGKAGSEGFKINETTIETIQQSWEQFFPGNPFDYFFLDDHYDQQYRAEKQFGTVFELFALLAIVIACLGLFGLSGFIIIQRTKEIAIRKVNGASVFSILRLVSNDFFKLIFFAIVISAPITWYFSTRWMEKYPFKVGFDWWLFLLAGFVIILISLLTVSFNIVSIAYSNPAKSIRNE